MRYKQRGQVNSLNMLSAPPYSALQCPEAHLFSPVFWKLVVFSLCEPPAHLNRGFPILSLRQLSFLLFLAPFSSCQTLIICFSFLPVIISTPLSQYLSFLSSCSSSSFQSIIGKDVREQLPLSPDKPLITLPLLGKPPWLDSSVGFRSHIPSIFKTHGVYKYYEILSDI